VLPSAQPRMDLEGERRPPLPPRRPRRIQAAAVTPTSSGLSWRGTMKKKTKCLWPRGPRARRWLFIPRRRRCGPVPHQPLWRVRDQPVKASRQGAHPTQGARHPRRPRESTSVRCHPYSKSHIVFILSNFT
jgi:hypothetical protein